MHYCNMTGLTPSTEYVYRFGDATVGLSDPFTFVSQPAVGSTGPVTAVMYGDMGLDYSDGTRAMLARWAQTAKRGDPEWFDFVVHNGDISYADNRIGVRNGTLYQDWMDVFYANVSRYAALKPYMLSPGNHEAPCAYGEYNVRAAAMPHWGSGSADVQYYSYTVGPLHVIALSGESGRLNSNTTAEAVWLAKDLEKAAAARARGEISWIVTHVHYPNIPTGYCSSMMRYCCADGNVGLRGELEGSERFRAGNTTCVEGHATPMNLWAEDLFVAHGVDVHFTAHQHVYERTTPVYRYKAYGNGTEPFPAGNDGSVFVSPKYPINVNNGCPGNVELQDVWMPRPSWSVGLRTNADGSGGTVANAYQDFGVVRMTAEAKSLRVEYIDSRNGSAIDAFTIRR